MRAFICPPSRTIAYCRRNKIFILWDKNNNNENSYIIFISPIQTLKMIVTLWDFQGWKNIISKELRLHLKHQNSGEMK